MLKKIGVVLLLLVIFTLMLVFTSTNPGFVTIDLFFMEVSPSIPLAFSVTFVSGWVFGLLCTTVFILRLIHERRQLRRKLSYTESELANLRSLPITDAD